MYIVTGHNQCIFIMAEVLIQCNNSVLHVCPLSIVQLSYTSICVLLHFIKYHPTASTMTRIHNATINWKYPSFFLEKSIKRSERWTMQVSAVVGTQCHTPYQPVSHHVWPMSTKWQWFVLAVTRHHLMQYAWYTHVWKYANL